MYYLTRHTITRVRTAFRSRQLHEISGLGSKYAKKLRVRAEQEGVAVGQLLENAREAEKKLRQNASKSQQPAANSQQVHTSKVTEESVQVNAGIEYKNSPVRPLSSILNMPRILSATTEQISALWTAYHASRSEGTGRGYICASIPVKTYEKMEQIAAQYPSFIVPVSRPTSQTETVGGASDSAVEFFYLQWTFYNQSSPQEISVPTPAQSIILFTPLQEYKLRQSFATPYLAVTHYTDLAQSHGIILLRGELTPSSSSGGYFLSQEDAQRLCIAVQKFYLWGFDGIVNDGIDNKIRLLKTFHEQPETFQWEELVKHAD